jgi:tRNA threonylcarbamoyladenosine biosynthesis protein TsaE
VRLSLPDAAATEALGERLASHLRPGDVVFLLGDLGAGKTTLVRGLHRGLGAAGRVRSPSYTTLIEYAGPTSLYHFDLYRYESAGAGFLAEFGEWIEGTGVVAIEWAERLEVPLDLDHLEVRLTTDGEGRVADVVVHGEAMTARGLLDGLR